VLPIALTCSLWFTIVQYKIDGDRDQSGQNYQSKEPSFGDSSGQFFSMYSDAAEEEDNKMVERWQKDADGILIFASPCQYSYFLPHNLEHCRPVYSLLPLLRSLL
jgi:hypothetical protein